VDADGAFDPRPPRRTGVVLSRLLWVRCGGRRDAALAATDLLARCPGFVLVALDAGETPPRVSLGAAFRLRQAARRAGVALLLVGRGVSRAPARRLAVRTRRDALAWAGSRRAPTRLAGMSTCLQVIRNQGAASPPSERLDERQLVDGIVSRVACVWVEAFAARPPSARSPRCASGRWP